MPNDVTYLQCIFYLQYENDRGNSIQCNHCGSFPLVMTYCRLSLTRNNSYTPVCLSGKFSCTLTKSLSGCTWWGRGEASHSIWGPSSSSTSSIKWLHDHGWPQWHKYIMTSFTQSNHFSDIFIRKGRGLKFSYSSSSCWAPGRTRRICWLYWSYLFEGLIDQHPYLRIIARPSLFRENAS